MEMNVQTLKHVISRCSDWHKDKHRALEVFIEVKIGQKRVFLDIRFLTISTFDVLWGQIWKMLCVFKHFFLVVFGVFFF